MENIHGLTTQILDIHQYFKDYTIRQINNALTLRNWIIGYHIVEYEQNGKDRAEYGEKTIKVLSEKLSKTGTKGFSDRNLRLFRQFYLEYPMIWQFITAKFHGADNLALGIWQSKISKSTVMPNEPGNNPQSVPIEVLIEKINYTHFVELINIKEPLKRTFYELQTIKNNWNVQQLKRNINSMLFERTGLSTNKEKILTKLKDEKLQQMPDIIKNPYLLEFIGLEEKSEYSETDLEQAIIDHLQTFLTEMGRGFCFEARQKRITFNNRHYRIDLVFYQRILKCHVLIDLKIGEFDHSDSGQMNLYLNYYKENEMCEGDKDPVGIILCSHKDEALVHYATGGLPQEVFVSQYLLQLPTEKELKEIIQNEIRRIEY